MSVIVLADVLGATDFEEAISGKELVSNKELSYLERAGKIATGLIKAGTTAVGLASLLKSAPKGSLGQCFPAGTLVSTSSGLRSIETIKNGDEVWSFDAIDNQWKLKKVLQTFANNHEGMSSLIEIGQEKIHATAFHPFWVIDGMDLQRRPIRSHLKIVSKDAELKGRWVDACDIQIGDKLHAASGDCCIVKSVINIPLNGLVFNFEVDDLHNYSVGKYGVLVHNDNGISPEVPNRVASNPKRGRFDFEHSSYDEALASARRNAGDLGTGTKKMYDPKTGTQIGEMSADGKRGWRIDSDHVNYWDWTDGKKGTGGKYGHDFFPPEQSGPHSRHIGYAPWGDQ